MLDGTSRPGVGEIAAVTAKIGGKIRALKCVQISKGTRANWAIEFIYMLKCLSVASNTDVDLI